MAQFETLAQRLKYARKAAGLTQDKLAENAGISRVAISQYESGETLSIKSHSITSYMQGARGQLRVASTWHWKDAFGKQIKAGFR